MRPWLRIVMTAVVLAAAAAGAWVYVNHRRLATQWEGQLGSYRVGRAETLQEAVAQIAALEQGPDRRKRLRELTGKWGTGNQQFDLYLAEHVRSAQSTELLRQTFSLEFAWREPLLARWAQYWCRQSPGEPDERIASIVEYLDVLAAAEPPREITWREVLDLQAVLALFGQPELAVRLKPENWRDRYGAWQKTRPARLPHVPRPERPFPDWRGPPPGQEGLGG